MKLAYALMALLLATAAAACNTVEGAGKDLQKAGEAVSNTADDAKN